MSCICLKGHSTHLFRSATWANNNRVRSIVNKKVPCKCHVAFNNSSCYPRYTWLIVCSLCYNTLSAWVANKRPLSLHFFQFINPFWLASPNHVVILQSAYLVKKVLYKWSTSKLQDISPEGTSSLPTIKHESLYLYLLYCPLRSQQCRTNRICLDSVPNQPHEHSTEHTFCW